jgi:hypothetical protein
VGFKFCLNTRNNKAFPLDLACHEHLSVRSSTNSPYYNVLFFFEVSFKEGFNFKSSICCMVLWTRYGPMFEQFFEFLKNRSFQKKSKNQRRVRFGSLKKKFKIKEPWISILPKTSKKQWFSWKNVISKLLVLWLVKQTWKPRLCYDQIGSQLDISLMWTQQVFRGLVLFWMAINFLRDNSEYYFIIVC